MDKLPQVTGGRLVRALEKAGFVVVRQRGSHVQVRREEGDGTVTTFPVPVHSGRNIKRGTLNGILRKANMSAADLAEFL